MDPADTVIWIDREFLEPDKWSMLSRLVRLVSVLLDLPRPSWERESIKHVQMTTMELQ